MIYCVSGEDNGLRRRWIHSGTELLTVFVPRGIPQRHAGMFRSLFRSIWRVSKHLHAFTIASGLLTWKGLPRPEQD